MWDAILAKIPIKDPDQHPEQFRPETTSESTLKCIFAFGLDHLREWQEKVQTFQDVLPIPPFCTVPKAIISMVMTEELSLLDFYKKLLLLEQTYHQRQRVECTVPRTVNQYCQFLYKLGILFLRHQKVEQYSYADIDIAIRKGSLDAKNYLTYLEALN